jgi:hypothetical protein
MICGLLVELLFKFSMLIGDIFIRFKVVKKIAVLTEFCNF